MRRSFLARSVLAALLFGGSASAPASPPAAPPRTDLGGPGTPLPLEITSHTALVDPGGADRRVLGYHPKPGATAAFETRTAQKMTMSITGPDGNPMPLPMGDLVPTTTIVTRNTVQKADASGRVPVVVELGAIQAEGGSPEMIEPMQRLNGSKFEMLIGTNGRPESIRVLDGSDPMMTEMVKGFADQMVKRIAMFPEEAVGAGAKWTTTMDANIGGIALRMTQQTTLVGATDTTVDLKVDLAMALGEGGFHPPGMPPGMNIDVSRFTGTGTGTTHIDLTTLATSGATTMDIDMAMAMAMPEGTPAGGGSMGMAMGLHQTTEMRPVP